MPLYLDIETYCTIDLRKVNAYRYAEDPSFRILMAAYAVDDDPVQVVFGDDVLDIPGLWDDDVEKVAHNAAFERICYSRVDWHLSGRDRGPYLDPEPWTDTMALAGEWGYPQGLGALAVALGAEPKDEAGTRLINLFCKPNRKGERVTEADKPEEWAEFVAYCAQDVATLRDVHRRLPGWPTEGERQAYLTDQRINDRGIALDTEMAALAEAAAEENRVGQELEVWQLTGVANAGSVQQLMAWLASQGWELPDLTAATVADAIERIRQHPRTDDVVRVLELRQELALVASKKYRAALDSVNTDGRLRGAFRFFGAHTGRWAGRGVQLHNLPRAQLETAAHTDAAVLDLKLGLGASAYELKALVRALFTGPFAVVDYAAIEARVVAWLAGEEWALEAFRHGRDIYVETAERMGGLTRAQGKVAVLALGYNGAVGSLQAMGATGTEDELERLVFQWRRANPAIVDFWAKVGRAFKHGGPAGELITVEADGTDRLIRLPSGRVIAYHDVQLQRSRGKERMTFLDPKRPGFRADTYGGRLVENITQAVARDVLAEALVRLDGAGYSVVGHVHDEVLTEVPGGMTSRLRALAAIEKLMTQVPAWAEGLPIDGEGFVTTRYRKG